MKRVLLFVAVILFCSCSQTPRKINVPESYFFSGEFVYFADAATFTDCVTGARLPVSHTKAYLRIERSYLMLNPTPAQPLYVEFRGRIVLEPPMEGDSTVKTIVIDSLIGFKKREMCTNEQMLAGVYESSTDERKEFLRLLPDYTFTGEVFDADGAYKAVSGVWARNAVLELLLIQQQPTNIVTGYQIIPSQRCIVDNSGGEPQVFTKVYL